MIARLFPLRIDWKGFGATHSWPFSLEDLSAIVLEAYMSQLTELVFADSPLTELIESQEKP